MDALLGILIVALILALMFRGPKTLPLIGGMFGRGIREARKEASDLREKRDGPTDPNKPSPPAPPAS